KSLRSRIATVSPAPMPKADNPAAARATFSSSRPCVISLSPLNILPLRSSQASGTIFSPRLSELLENGLPPGPGFVAGFLVCLYGIRRVFTRAHKSVSCAFISDRVIGLARLFHQLLALGHRRRHARIATAIEAIDRSLDPGNRLFAI